jgi:hypothetical protein
MKLFTWIAGQGRRIIDTIGSSAGAGSAGSIPHLDSSGKLDSSFLPSTELDSTSCAASENLSAGDQVNLWSDSGTLKARKADAANGRPAHGYVLASVLANATALVYHDGTLTGLSGLTVGADYYLSATTPGGLVAVASVRTNTGDMVQFIGTAKSASALLWQPDTLPAVIA